MRSRTLALILLAATGLWLAAPAAQAGAPTNPSFGKWFPRISPNGTRCAGPMILTQTKTGGTDDGCGHTFGGSTYEWTAKTPLKAAIPAGTKIAGTIYVTTYQPDNLSLTATLSGLQSDGTPDVTTDPISSGSVSSPGSFVGLNGDGYTAIPFKGKVSKTIPAGDNLDLAVNISVTQDNFLGYVAPHQSVIVLG